MLYSDSLQEMHMSDLATDTTNKANAAAAHASRRKPDVDRFGVEKVAAINEPL